MSDTESTAAPPHPSLGGKSIKSLERPRYKSWRKKYRKMRYRFDGSLEENKKLFKEEQKLECIAKRLREELDGLLDLSLDLNQNPAIPPSLRFDVSHQNLPNTSSAAPEVVPHNITPEEANALLMEYSSAVARAQIPAIDLQVVRQQVDDRLAAQEVEALSALEESVPHAVPSGGNNDLRNDDLEGDAPPGYLSLERENEYLLRLDAKLGDSYSLTRANELQQQAQAQEENKHWAELTPRELERQAELLNPQSQHNWLKHYWKVHLPNLAEDDNESLAGGGLHENVKSSGGGSAARRRPASTKPSNLAKQVGDRAFERATKEGVGASAGVGGGWSPSAASGLDEDELGVDEGPRKKGRDPDGTYRLKGGKGGGGGSGKGKRKRSGEDVGDAGGGGAKKAKVEGDGD